MKLPRMRGRLTVVTLDIFQRAAVGEFRANAIPQELTERGKHERWQSYLTI